jgi:hypothetical protein
VRGALGGSVEAFVSRMCPENGAVAGRCGVAHVHPPSVRGGAHGRRTSALAALGAGVASCERCGSERKDSIALTGERRCQAEATTSSSRHPAAAECYKALQAPRQAAAEADHCGP